MVVVADLELGEEHNLVMDKFFQYLRSLQIPKYGFHRVQIDVKLKYQPCLSVPCRCLTVFPWLGPRVGSTGCSTPGTLNVVHQGEGRGHGGGGHFEICGYSGQLFVSA